MGSVVPFSSVHLLQQLFLPLHLFPPLLEVLQLLGFNLLHFLILILVFEPLYYEWERQILCLLLLDVEFLRVAHYHLDGATQLILQIFPDQRCRNRLNQLDVLFELFVISLFHVRVEGLGFLVPKCLSFFVVVDPGIAEISGEADFTLRVLGETLFV